MTDLWKRVDWPNRRARCAGGRCTYWVGIDPPVLYFGCRPAAKPCSLRCAFRESAGSRKKTTNVISVTTNEHQPPRAAA